MDEDAQQRGFMLENLTAELQFNPIELSLESKVNRMNHVVEFAVNSNLNSCAELFDAVLIRPRREKTQHKYAIDLDTQVLDQNAIHSFDSFSSLILLLAILPNLQQRTT